MNPMLYNCQDLNLPCFCSSLSNLKQEWHKLDIIIVLNDDMCQIKNFHSSKSLSPFHSFTLVQEGPEDGFKTCILQAFELSQL